jgi:hypothetical protein
MNPKAVRFAVVMLVLAATGGLAAHHSVPVNFDQSKEVSVEGVLTEIKWVNPHAHFRINVKQPDGTLLEWLVEMGATNTMKRAGFPMDEFMVGQTYTIIGPPGRRDRAVLMDEVIMPDGRHLTPTMRPRTPGVRDQNGG